MQQLDRSVEILLDVDKLLASHPLYRLEEWVDMARDWGKTDLEKDAYEANAKRLITTWGGFQEDYAARFWSGLIKDYYIPRMKLYFSEQRADLDRWEEKLRGTIPLRRSKIRYKARLNWSNDIKGNRSYFY